MHNGSTANDNLDFARPADSEDQDYELVVRVEETTPTQYPTTVAEFTTGMAKDLSELRHGVHDLAQSVKDGAHVVAVATGVTSAASYVGAGVSAVTERVTEGLAVKAAEDSKLVAAALWDMASAVAGQGKQFLTQFGNTSRDTTVTGMAVEDAAWHVAEATAAPKPGGPVVGG